MKIFNYDEMSIIGKVQSVDTSNVVIHVDDTTLLSKLQVNHLVVLRSSKQNQSLIGLVVKIMRKYGDESDLNEGEEIATSDIIKVLLIGTLLNKVGERENVFKRTLESVPEIDADCFIMSEQNLTDFMSVVSSTAEGVTHSLKIGTYAINNTATAWIDGNKLFQRHAVVVGSTGSGKSYTVATLVEQIAKLQSANALLFDIHGEYGPITEGHVKHYKIAGPTDNLSDDVLFLPYWLLTYEEMTSLMIDRSDNNAPNQAMLFSRTVLEKKKEFLEQNGKEDMVDNITIDSPIPYSMDRLIEKLSFYNTEMVPGVNKDKKGDFNGQLSRFIQRLESKKDDKRLNFMFCSDDNLLDYDYMSSLCSKLMSSASNGGGVKIIDFSEVPSDILPLIVSLIARVIFFVQQWVEKAKIAPIALFCDEAHLYIPESATQGTEKTSLQSFERISKEGRKYGLSLIVITQRPSEVDRTVLSQSSNFIAMKLTNAEDQNVIKRLLPDSMGNFAELLPVLDVGEALVVGDASLLPSRINVSEPIQCPNSNTVKFWDEWSKEHTEDTVSIAVEALRKQSK